MEEPSSIVDREIGRHILKEAIGILRARTGLPAAVEAEQLLIAPNQRLDALLRIQIGKLEHPFFVEVKNLVSNAKHVLARIQSNPAKGHWLLIANKISPQACESLRHSGIGYIDLTGNIFIPLFLLFQGVQPPTQDQRESSERVQYRPSIHTDSVILTLFHLLADPENLNRTQRELAELTGLSPATVNKAIASLQDRGFLLQRSDGKKILKQKRDLIARWCTSYNDVFRQHQYRGRFRRVGPDREHWARDTLIELHGSVWGGEYAAAQYTKYLKPEKYTIYFRGEQNEILNRLRLSPSEDGDVELLQAFWPDTYDQRVDLAPPLIVYADLIGSGIERNREAADVLYEQFKLAD